MHSQLSPNEDARVRSELINSSIRILYGDGRPLTSISRTEVMEHFHDHGVVLFRGFASGMAEFVALTELFCHQFLEHVSMKLRPPTGADGTVTKVLVGNGAVSLHAEMNYSPLRPDALWFHCATPSGQGGETIVADSRHILATLAPATRHGLEERRIRYRSLSKPEQWRHITKQQAREQAIALMCLLPDCHGEAVGDEDIQFDFITDAIRPTGRSGEPGFLNSIANVHEYSDQPIRVTFADGEPIPQSFFEDIAQTGAACAEPLNWQSGDVALIDNSRMMHGRNAFSGGERNIDVRFGLLRPELK